MHAHIRLLEQLMTGKTAMWSLHHFHGNVVTASEATNTWVCMLVLTRVVAWHDKVIALAASFISASERTVSDSQCSILSGRCKQVVSSHFFSRDPSKSPLPLLLKPSLFKKFSTNLWQVTTFTLFFFFFSTAQTYKTERQKLMKHKSWHALVPHSIQFQRDRCLRWARGREWGGGCSFSAAVTHSCASKNKVAPWHQI